MLFLSAATGMSNDATALDNGRTVQLKSAIDCAILAQTGISSSIAVSPIAATAITGLSLNQVTGQDWSTSTQITAKVYAPGS
jgi:hypothetical protein